MLTGKPPTLVDLSRGQLIPVFESGIRRIRLETDPAFTTGSGASARLVGFDTGAVNRLKESRAQWKADYGIASGDRYAYVHRANPIIR
jgi:hypothetical protein